MMCQDQGFALVPLPDAAQISSQATETFDLLTPEYRRYSASSLPVNIQTYIAANSPHLSNQADFTEKQALYLMALMFKVFLYQSPHFISESVHNIMNPSPYYGMQAEWTASDFEASLRDARRYDDQIGSQTQPCAEFKIITSQTITIYTQVYNRVGVETQSRWS